MAPPAPAKGIRCSFCTKEFGRVEHLKRHELIHKQERPFTCQICSKDFIRKDALQRHEQTHRDVPSLLQRGARACISCALAKSRCSGETPCMRCRDRDTNCAYPETTTQEGNPEQIAMATTSTIAPPKVANPDSAQQQAQDIIAIPGAPLSTDSSLMIDPEFWADNVLATTNWLDAVDDCNFADFGFSTTSLPNTWTYSTASPFGLNGQAQLNSQEFVQPPQSIISTPSIAKNSTIGAAKQNHVAETGEYYVDGEPARLPRVKRRRLSSLNQVPELQSEQWSGFSLRCYAAPDADLSQSIRMTEQTYEWLMNQYTRLGLEPPPPWQAFEPCEFPAKNLFAHALSLYFTSFDQALPFVHSTETSKIGSHPVLACAMSGIGFQFDDQLKKSPQFCKSLHEFVRRVFLTQQETAEIDNGLHAFDLSRARIINLIGLASCDDDQLRRYAVNNKRHVLADVMAFARYESQVERIGGPLEEEWQAWCHREGAIRLAYSAWLVDCMWTYQHQTRPCLSLHDGNIQLPSSEKLWQAQSAREWLDLGGLGSQPSPPLLQEALQQLYIDKRLPRERGEFARILMIHGLFHRSWEVERYFTDPLSAWEPTAQRQASADVLPKSPIWPPTRPIFLKWQNSACDALDVLHWQANATIGQASGLEHPTVMHLHLARIVLLAPYEQILGLARSLAATNTSNVDHGVEADRQVIQRWAVQHQYKARLSIIHAGVVFWHIRRYSIDAFYEAPAVALAALTLWAFGTFASRQVSAKSSSKSTRELLQAQTAVEQVLPANDDDATCPIILLDRPTDDELVQQFIRQGHRMRAHLTGVGDLYGAEGPRRVLLQASQLLGILRCWDVSLTWLHLLQRLANATSR